MKPKMYRKTKASKPDPKMTAWNPKNDSGGGKVQGTTSAIQGNLPV